MNKLLKFETKIIVISYVCFVLIFTIIDEQQKYLKKNPKKQKTKKKRSIIISSEAKNLLKICVDKPITAFCLTVEGECSGCPVFWLTVRFVPEWTFLYGNQCSLEWKCGIYMFQ